MTTSAFKKIVLAATALSVLASPTLTFAQITDQQVAQSRDWDRDRDDRRENDRRDDRRGDDRYDHDRNESALWKRGQRVPDRFRRSDYYVTDYKRYKLRSPPRNHRWVRVDDRFVLMANNSGMIIEIVLANDGPRNVGGPPPRYDWRNPPPPPPGRNRDDVWRARYSRSYNLDDDRYYQECRNKPDPAGALVGALAGGLLGNAVAGRGDKTGATVAGVIAGGAIGMALTTKVQCEDRSYMYKTYSDGFNAGRPGARYNWENPRTRNRGEMEVIDYYEDEDNFRCAVYANTIYIDGRREEARGRACQQPDGNWAIID